MNFDREDYTTDDLYAQLEETEARLSECHSAGGTTADAMLAMRRDRNASCLCVGCGGSLTDDEILTSQVDALECDRCAWDRFEALIPGLRMVRANGTVVR